MNQSDWLKEHRKKDTDCFKCKSGDVQNNGGGVYCLLENSKTYMNDNGNFICDDFKKKGKGVIQGFRKTQIYTDFYR